MNTGVVELFHQEVVCFDADRLEELCRNDGDENAERTIADVLGQLAGTFAIVGHAWDAEHWKDLDRACRTIEDLSHRIGMTSLRRVARDVRTCIAQGDGVALAATVRRMRRLGDTSTHSVWTLDDISL